MLDFTSALYLGFDHESCELRPWKRFTTGVPAAQGTPRIARELARALAALQGCERSTVAPSTLHLFWDLFGMVGSRDLAVLVDGGAYAIARWGVERIAMRGSLVRSFGHYNPESLAEQLHAIRQYGGQPVVVADGFCPSCGRLAPVVDFLYLVRGYGGLLVLDDTQSLGIWGYSPGRDAPYGQGGGGILRRNNVDAGNVVLVCSMAKAFGVPLAVLSASADLVERFEDKSETRMHCSPPALATLHAAEHALALNRIRGEAARLRLARLVSSFGVSLQAYGIQPTGGLFPVQSLHALSADKVQGMHERLRRSGIRCVMSYSRHDSSPMLSFLITTRHTTEQVNHAARQLGDAIGRHRRQLIAKLEGKHGVLS